jgi:phosphoglycolate phosphatase-like HAD superfamily hydrolase
VTDPSPAADLPVAVIDIDGVVADVRHRLHHVERKPKNWEAFFSAAADDPPLEEGVRRVLDLLPHHRVVFLTGRPERLRRTTQRWLEAHGLGGHPLVMRKGRDFRPARQTKAEELAVIARTGRVVLVLDDDPEVIAHLTAEGWPAELATWVPHAKSLRDAQEKDGRT